MKKSILPYCIILVITVVLFSGCASVVSRSSYPVYVRTNPIGAKVTIIDKKGKEVYKGQSPATVLLKSGAGYFSRAEYQVKLSYPGYAEKIIPIYCKLNGWYFGNLLIGGVLGMLIVDPATGAMWKIENPVIDETLFSASVSTSPTPELKIIDVNSISEELKTQLVRLN